MSDEQPVDAAVPGCGSAPPRSGLISLAFRPKTSTIGLLLIGQGAAQLLLKVPLPIGAILGFMVSFAISTLVALALIIVLFRNVTNPAGAKLA